jgi:hypothetical protein
LGNAISDGEKPRTRRNRVEAEHRGEMLLPRADVEAIVLDRGRWSDGVTPRAAQPLDGVAVARLDGDRAQRVDHVVGAHFPQPVEQRARVLEHHPRLRPLVDQLGDELAHPLIAPAEHRGIVVIADVGVLGHVSQVADQRSRSQRPTPGRNERLVHMQRDRECAVDTRERIPDIGHRVHGTPARFGNRSADQSLLTAQVGQPVDKLCELVADVGCLAHGA